VLNGSGKAAHATNIASYLEFYGLTASAPNQRPDDVPATTRIVAYNGAETRLPVTIEFLEGLFDTTVVTEADSSARVDIVITTAASTPELVPPEGP
jgi:hypothetical protein